MESGVGNRMKEVLGGRGNGEEQGEEGEMKSATWKHKSKHLQHIISK